MWPEFDQAGKPDWIADTRILSVMTFAKTPREIAAHFMREVEMSKEFLEKPV